MARVIYTMEIVYIIFNFSYFAGVSSNTRAKLGYLLLKGLNYFF